MRYIQLNNDSYVLYLSIGLRTLGRTAFNFNKIKKLVAERASEEEILPLLKIPDLPDGTFEVYTTNENELLYLHTPNTGKQELRHVVSDSCLTLDMLEALDSQFVGVYASLDDVLEDWPEYLL